MQLQLVKTVANRKYCKSSQNTKNEIKKQEIEETTIIEGKFNTWN